VDEIERNLLDVNELKICYMVSALKPKEI